MGKRFVMNAKFIVAVLVASTFLPLCVIAQGDLMIMPRRLVFEENRRIHEITLANTGQDTATYSISFLQYHMTDDGNFETITEPLPGQMFADQYLRFFPRAVTLAPGESQIIRMQFRRRPGMAEGEYRSHIFFRAVPEERPLGEEEPVQDPTEISIRLIPVFGITIPAIIRKGNVWATVAISNLNIVKESINGPQLKLTFNREGNKSVFGDLTVDHISPDGSSTNIGFVSGIAIYTPNLIRNFTMPLVLSEGVDLSSGKLIIRFSSASDLQPEIFAEAELKL